MDLEVVRSIIHYNLHFLFPGILAYIFFPSIWKKAWLILILTMVIDLDHLLATPFFDPLRCSINYHPLHTYYAAVIYVGMLFLKITRIVAVGLLFHLITDALDCLWL
ncbi:DUF6122 family protein [Aureibaculum sp. 2210JD6-5]|uniref:DUF6122 family protein n=1 Tax=Aureibaculum sp. 2210JD6-5 TaxID=3103957 RepID=UPI002AAC73A0|nr:DUF6122 family protein [Aureibaculum sp. 2210JD6-5]MDY7395546.1 DUF6122 family protein [Aureibaculum sp. 2210JD6-5]